MRIRGLLSGIARQVASIWAGVLKPVSRRPKAKKKAGPSRAELRAKLEAQLSAAHKRCFSNRDEIEASDVCGCIYCTCIYPQTEVDDWTDEGKTALCPYCDIDSVVGSASGFPITKAFLNRMRGRYF